MTRSFREWLACPTCEGDGDVKVFAYGTEVVLECYDCETISEYAIGEEIPFAEVSPEEVSGSNADGRAE